jgi:3'-phosphoadenosine 5'-phosphosulfate sulfotransferase (PAPS reductase)/FAD synthetase
MTENIHDKARLRELQSLPLDRKILITQTRIIEWYSRHKGQVYVSFSGGKDSTVLLAIARKCFPDIEAVFVDTGLEYPEVRQFVKTFDNVTIIRPKMMFNEVIQKYGYPLISKEVSKKISEYRSKPDGYTNLVFNSNSEKIKRYGSRYDLSKWIPLRDSNIPVSDKCCNVMKKSTAKAFEKASGKKCIVATLAEESALRQTEWIRSGCNSFDAKRPISKPMSFWTEQDILQYIKEYNIPYCPVYGDIVEADGKLKTTGCDRTGCIFCAFGCHTEKGVTRFQRLKETHPRQYQYCINGGEYDETGKWIPNKEGLGMGHVFDELNSIYGEDFIRYK